MKLIYADHNATTPIAPEVIAAMRPYLEELWGNPSSTYPFGAQLARPLERAREQVAKLIGARRPSEIVFTSSGTESDRTGIHAALDADPQKRHIITSAVEHPAVLSLCHHLEKQNYEISYLSVNHAGQLQLDELARTIRPDTALVTLMWANNETGVLFPMHDVARLCEARGVPLHVDAVQAVGKIPIDVSKVPVTYLAMSGHKLHAPKGVGALYVRRGARFTPLFFGHQEMNRRGGTENVAGIVGLGVACELARARLEDMTGRIRALRDRLEQSLLQSVPQTFINGDLTNRLSNTSNISFVSIDSDALLLLLSELGICASSGSACTSGSPDPSHVLKAMQVPRDRLQGVLRLSFSSSTTAEEVDQLCERIPPLVKKLRGSSCS